MNFTSIDSIIEQWSRDNDLPLYTQYREAEVRSFEVVLPTGERRQIWVENDGKLTVSVWDYRKRRRDFAATPSNLRDQLDAALRQAKAWK